MRWRIMLKTSLSMIHRCPGLHCYHGTQVQLQEMESVCVSRLVTSDLCNPMDYSPPGSSVQGILQARILEWIAISFSRGTSQPRDWTLVSCIAGRFFTVWVTGKSMCFTMFLHLLKNQYNHTVLRSVKRSLRNEWPIQSHIQWISKDLFKT